MITPLVMLLLMTGPYAALRSVRRGTGRVPDLADAAAVGLALLFVFTGIGHFVQTASMMQMLPPWVPSPRLLVYLSGVGEFAIAAGLLARRTRRAAGWAAVTLLVAFFPVNVYAAMQRAPLGGHAWGPKYLLIRGPLQLAILLWAYWFTVRPARPLTR